MWWKTCILNFFEYNVNVTMAIQYKHSLMNLINYKS